MLNSNYGNLKESYLFSDIARRVSEFSEKNPDRRIIKMGIGDVTRPLCKAVTEAMKKASDEMGTAEGFHGYGPEQGYAFLRDAVRDYYKKYGVSVDSNEIFISDGAKSDVGNILDIFSRSTTVLVPDPVYPVYVDTNTMDGRKISYMNATEQNGFLPLPEEGINADLIYLCSPNNPTGAVYNRAQLREWVNFANRNGSVILFDSAYESFVSDESLPHSIFEIEGAKSCAIEFCSLSKTAGFTGTRCGYTVICDELVRDGKKLSKLWLRRQTTKFNGVSYIVQRGAEAVFTEEGQRQIHENIAAYKKNAALMAETLTELSIPFTGGLNSPYIWMQCPDGMDSWTFFDYLLNETGIVGTPGSGFGKNGEGFFRLTAFSTYENTAEAMKLLKQLLKK